MANKRDNMLEQLSAYLDGELTAEDVLAVESALAGDAALAEELEAMRQMREMLGSIPEEDAPPYLSDRILARMNRNVKDRFSARPLRSARWITYAAAAVVLITVGISYIALVQSHQDGGEIGGLAVRGLEPVTQPRAPIAIANSGEDNWNKDETRIVETLETEGATAGWVDDVQPDRLPPTAVDGPGSDSELALADEPSFDRAVRRFEKAMGDNSIAINRRSRAGNIVEYDVVTDVATAHRVMDEFQVAQASDPDPAPLLAQASAGFGDWGTGSDDMAATGGNAYPAVEEDSSLASLPTQQTMPQADMDEADAGRDTHYFRQVAMAPRSREEDGLDAVELPSDYLADADLTETGTTRASWETREDYVTNAYLPTPEEQVVYDLHMQEKRRVSEEKLTSLEALEVAWRTKSEALMKEVAQLEMLTAKLSREDANEALATARMELQDARKELAAAEADRMSMEEEVAELNRLDSDYAMAEGETIPIPADESDDSEVTEPTSEVMADITKSSYRNEDAGSSTVAMRFVLQEIAPETARAYQGAAQMWRKTVAVDQYYIEEFDDLEVVDTARVDSAGSALDVPATSVPTEESGTEAPD
jgi:hypothetical protein